MARDTLTWRETTLNLVRSLNKETFLVSELYPFVPMLEAIYPKNNNIKDKLRQQLQYLGKDGFVVSVDGRGEWKYLAIEKEDEIDFEANAMTLRIRPKPNARISAVRERGSDFKGKTSPLRDRLRDKLLGEAGEKIVIEHERRQLLEAGLNKLSDRVEQVSETVGDHIGFDVLSFSKDGRKKCIEVKTTVGGENTPFHISENQLEKSATEEMNYWLYRVYNFRPKLSQADMYKLQGSLRPQLDLKASSYRATPL